jgi:hypothetical protein
MINYPELDEMTASDDFNAIVDACINQIRAAGVIYESFVSRFINGLVYRSPALITRIPVLTPRRAHSFKRRFCSALRIKYQSQWSPSSLVIPTTVFRSADPQLGSKYDFGWAKVCTYLTVGGDHSTIFENTAT